MGKLMHSYSLRLTQSTWFLHRSRIGSKGRLESESCIAAGAVDAVINDTLLAMVGHDEIV
jgi:hypothetical protein